MEDSKMNLSIAMTSENIENAPTKTNYECQSLQKPFVTSRLLEQNKIDPSGTGATLPGVRIPEKPQNWPRKEEMVGIGFVRSSEPKKRQVRMNNYEPSQSIGMGERVLSIHPVNHELGSEVLAVRFESRIEIYALRLRTVRNDEFFTLTKIQEFIVSEKDSICTMAIGFNSNIGIGGKKLAYAFALHENPLVYYVKDEPTSLLPFNGRLTERDTDYVKCFDTQCASVQEVVFDGENGIYLAALCAATTCKVWNVEAGKIKGTVALESEGVAVRFHRSQPNLFMVAQRSGWIKFYNVNNMVVMSAIFSSTTPLYTADWPLSDPTGVAAGALNKVHLFRHVDRNCEHFRSMDNRGLNSMIRFSTSDRFLFAIVNSFKNDLRMFNSQMQAPLWVQLDKEVQWIEWVYGKPFLMACVGEYIEFYEATNY